MDPARAPRPTIRRDGPRHDRPRISFTFLLDLAGPCGPATLASFRAAIAPLVEGPVNPEGRLGVVALRGRSAEVLVPPTGSAERARRQLAGLATGGAPPLAPGLRLALQLAVAEATRQDTPIPLLVVISDGAALEVDARALVPAARAAALGVPALVMDPSPPGRRASPLRRVADALRAPLVRPGAVSTELIVSTALNAAAIAARDDRWAPPRRPAPGGQAGRARASSAATRSATSRTRGTS